MPLSRRIKTVEFDGAVFTIYPLTYSQLEQYAEMVKSIASADLASKEIAHKARANVFFVICSGLNTLPADSDAITEKELFEGMDDVLAGKLWRAIMEFSGITLASDEELQKLVEERGRIKPEGEAPASC